MSAFGVDGFAAVRPVRVEVFTSAYRVTGTIRTRFGRVAEILNQLSATHLPLADAAVHRHADGQATSGGSSVVVSVDEILLMIAPDLAGAPSPEMRIPKRPVPAQLAIPPLWVTGTVHVPVDSRALDGLLNVPDRFLPVTDVTISAVGQADIEAAVVALRRDRAHVIQLTDDDHPSEVLDERTAEAWLHARDEPG